MACGTIRECATNKNYYYINVVCIQIVPYWGTNRECGIIWRNTVIALFKRANSTVQITFGEHSIMLHYHIMANNKKVT